MFFVLRHSLRLLTTHKSVCTYNKHVTGSGRQRRNIAATLAARGPSTLLLDYYGRLVVNNGSIRCKTRERERERVRELIVYQQVARVGRAVIHFGSPASGRWLRASHFVLFFVREGGFRLDARIRFDSVICLSFSSAFCMAYGVLGRAVSAFRSYWVY